MNPLRLLKLPLDTVIEGVTGKYRTRGRAADADCVLGFAFGYRGKTNARKPGLSNQDLANVIIRNFDSLPKILQLEIADAYKSIGGSGKVEVISKRRSRDLAMAAHELDTYEVALQARDIMSKNGWKTALVAAHPYHMPRVQAVCDKVGINWVATDDFKNAVDFDPQSSQKWTRSLDKWIGYEPLAITYYTLKGWL